MPEQSTEFSAEGDWEQATESRFLAGSIPLGMAQIKGFFGAAEAAPLQNRPQLKFFCKLRRRGECNVPAEALSDAGTGAFESAQRQVARAITDCYS